MASDDPVEVHAYLDYRAFLRDHYAAKKAKSKGFSYRAFSRKAGVSSPNYLKLVIEGQRNLSTKMAERFARACGLAEEDSRYFVSLVSFNQARTSAEKEREYEKITSFRSYRQAHHLDLAHAAYYGDWYMPAIRELAALHDFRPEPAWIAEQLVPPITPVQAARALETLVELGLLVEDERGKLVQANTIVSTGPETRGVHIAAYHRAMTARALESIDLVPKEERDISALTLGLSRGGLRKLKDRLQRFRRELLELSALEEEPAQVVQLNFQLFPLSRAPRRPGPR
jgi:uncharacterized protein (TIGR02147 family)